MQHFFIKCIYIIKQQTASQSVKCLHIRKRIRSLRLMHTRFARRDKQQPFFNNFFPRCRRICDIWQ